MSVQNTRSHLQLRPYSNFFAFDLASVETYLVVGRLLRLGLDLEWYPIPAALVSGKPTGLDLDVARARERAEALGLPLFLPKRHPEPVPNAMRGAAWAAHTNTAVAGQFINVCSRLAFAGGFDLDGHVLRSVSLARTDGLNALPSSPPPTVLASSPTTRPWVSNGSKSRKSSASRPCVSRRTLSAASRPLTPSYSASNAPPPATPQSPAVSAVDAGL